MQSSRRRGVVFGSCTAGGDRWDRAGWKSRSGYGDPVGMAFHKGGKTCFAAASDLRGREGLSMERGGGGRGLEGIQAERHRVLDELDGSGMALWCCAVARWYGREMAGLW